MELIKMFLLGALGILAAAAARLLADEFKAWAPWIIERLIRRAVRELPQNLRERYEEEWQSHVDEIPGDIGKVISLSNCC
jgi:phage terminase Nu1 subunit (DNA packaging protein)